MLPQPQGVLISFGGPFRSPALHPFGLQVSVPVFEGSDGQGSGLCRICRWGASGSPEASVVQQHKG
jgi:hypothetical protein